MRLVAMIAILLAMPLHAQELVFDPFPTQTCLASVTDGPESHDCIGLAAYDCMQQGGGDTTIGMGFCLNGELEFWDAKLNEAYQTLRAEMSAHAADVVGSAMTPADALREMQRAWIGYRDARCSFEAAQWYGGTGAGPAYLGCAMQATADQTLYLWSVFSGAR